MFRKQHLVASCVFASALASSLIEVDADPLPGQQLKFQQLPLAGAAVGTDTTGQPAFYYGHNEPSTATLNPATGQYSGFFFADDFADKVSTPVVHVKWWGSYPGVTGTPSLTAQKFLLAWEADVPVGPGNPYSHPGQVLQHEIVTLGALSPGSGTFTAAPYQTDPNTGEVIFQYNAELKNPFPEQADQVYWLKIVALDDGPAPGFVWGWHNRDYTQQDSLASNVPMPGEFDEAAASVPPFITPVWHFQDDAVRGGLTLTPNAAGQYTLNQFNMTPSSYLDGSDGPAAVPGISAGISQFSQDLAFELYTVPIPEPASLGLLASAGLMFLGRRSRRA